MSERIAISEAEALAKETMARYDPSHDIHHVNRVRKTAMSLAHQLSSLKPDLLVVEIAALLHDVLDKKYVSEEQYADPYQYFLPFFRSVAEKGGVDLIEDSRAELIIKIMENVSWTNEKKLHEAGQWSTWHQECIELHCVQDADRLDAIGAFGIMRCVAYSSRVNRPLFVPPDDPASAWSAIQHFHDKLIHIHERLKTKPGKLLGQKRHKVLIDFLASVEEESSTNEPA